VLLDSGAVGIRYDCKFADQVPGNKSEDNSSEIGTASAAAEDDAMAADLCGGRRQGRGTGGYAFAPDGGGISWGAKPVPIVATSMLEAKYVAHCSYAK
jgi:hypothetical protein